MSTKDTGGWEVEAKLYKVYQISWDRTLFRIKVRTTETDTYITDMPVTKGVPGLIWGFRAMADILEKDLEEVAR